MYNKVIWSIIWVQITEIILNVQIFYSFLSFILFRREKNEPRKAADCTSAAKLASLFTKRRKTVASLTLRCGAFNEKNLQSFHAATVRSGFGTTSLCSLCALR
jgi:hypothetical protein